MYVFKLKNMEQRRDGKLQRFPQILYNLDDAEVDNTSYPADSLSVNHQTFILVFRSIFKNTASCSSIVILKWVHNITDRLHFSEH